MKSAYLVTGAPGIGKTTLIRQVISTMRLRAAGFYTEDLRTAGVREGFRIVTLEGQTILLAATGLSGQASVSKYGVDLEALNRVGVAALRQAIDHHHVLVVDEIGKMQLFSKEFRRTVLLAVQQEHPMLGTIMAGRNPHADRIKHHANVEVLTLTDDNRPDILNLLRSKFV